MKFPLFSPLKRLAGGIFGQLQWVPPSWLRWICRSLCALVSKHPKGLLAGLLVLVMTGWGGMRWWRWKEAHRVRPDGVVNVVRELTVRASDPSTPSYGTVEKQFHPSLLRVDFSGNAAPLGAFGGHGRGADELARPVSGVTLDPPHPGKWHWSSDAAITFEPGAPWPPGRKYEVTLEPSLALTPEVRLKQRRLTVTTAPLAAKVEKMEFYIDPQDPANQQVVGSLRLTHPVAEAELLKHLERTVIGGTPLFETSGPAWTLVQDPDEPRHWWARSPRVVVPSKEDFAVFSITAGLVSQDGGEPLAEVASHKTVVRDKFSGLSVQSATASLVDDSEGEPVQHLFLSTKGYVRPEALEGRVEIRHLPWRSGEAAPRKSGDRNGASQAQGEEGGESVEEPWNSVSEIPADVLAAAPLVKAAPVPPESPLTLDHIWRLPPLAPGQLLVRISKGLPALGGYELEDDWTALVTVPEFPHLLEFTATGGLLSLNGERKLSLKSRGVSHIRYTVARIPLEQINHLASMTRGRFESPVWRSSAFDQENIAHIRRKVVSTGKVNDWQAVWSTFDFREFLEQADPSDPEASRGMFFLTAEAVEPRPKVKGKAKGQEKAEADGNGEDEQSQSAEDGGDPDNGNGHDSSGEADGQDPDWRLVTVVRNPLPIFNGKSDNGEDDGDSSQNGPSRFVLVTDLGLLVKETADGSRDVFVQSIHKGGPAAGVSLTVVAKNGEPLQTITTDAEGHARLEAADGFTGDRKPVVLVARRGNDASFLPMNRNGRKLDFSRFETGGLGSGASDTLDAFVFTERGIYRPGETLHAAAVVRLRSGGMPPEGLPVTAVVRNSASRLVFRQTLTLPPDGMLDFSGGLREGDPTGVYSLEVNLFPDKKDPVSIGGSQFRVEDFEPDTMKLKVDLPGVPERGWMVGPEVTAVLDLRTLFDFPAAARRITGKVTLDPAEFSFPEWPGYTFAVRSPLNLTAGRERDLGEIESKPDGSGQFDLGLGTLAGMSTAFTFTAEAFEPDSGRSVAVSKSGLISTMTSAVGWKADGDLGYIGKDAPRRIRMVCIGPDLKPMDGPPLTQVLTTTRRLSVLTKDTSGSYRYVSTEKKEELSRLPATVPSAGLDVTLPTDQTGEFRMEFLDATGQLVAACNYSVTGKGNAGRSLEQNAELEMKPSRGDWESGQDLEVSLRAPFTGAGLLTVEREKVWGWKWFRSTEKESVQTIRVPEDMEGTAYVQAAFVRAADSPEVFMTPLSYAVQPVRVNYERRLMPLTLEVPERIRPGETLRATLRSPEPSRAVIYMVDEGIHQVTRYELPKPRDFFLRPRSLEVETSQILDLLMPEYTILGRSRAFGGDGDIPMNLNPFQRKREAPVVYWSGLVSAGPDGVTMEYAVPDSFGGQLTVMAVAAGPSGYGSAQSKTVVRGPFVLTPNAPRFAAPGDTFTVSLTVANNVDNPGPDAGKVMTRLLTSPNVRVIQSPDAAEIAPGREGTVRFDIEVREPLGNASLTFSAEAAGASAARTVTLSVRPPTPRMTTVQSGYYRLPDHEVKPARDLYPEFADREISSSALPLNLARGLARWLQEFPHGCTEQIVSRAMPRLLLSSDASFGFDRAAATTDLGKVFSQLRGRQAPGGGFGTWDNRVPAGAGIDFLSVYVTDFLISAREAGFAVPDDLLRPALKNLREMAAMTPNGAMASAAQARAIYLLTRNGEVTTNYLLNLRDTLDKTEGWETGPSALWMACTHALLHQDKEAREIVSGWKKSRKRPVDVWRFWQEQPLALESLDIALMSRHFPDVAGAFSYDDLQPMLSGLEKAEYNTYSAACCVQALKAWSDLQKQSGVQTSLTELTATAPPRLLTAPGSGLLTSGFTAEAAGLRFGLIRPEGAPDLGAFYQVMESGFDRALPTAELREGVEITRRWALVDKPGPFTPVPVGESVRMELHVRNLTADVLPDLAIVDLLPGGWEVEDGSLRPGPDGAPGANFVDMREDRNVIHFDLGTRDSRVFSYRIRPVCAGTVVMPPVFVNSLYRPAVQGRDKGDKITAVPR